MNPKQLGRPRATLPHEAEKYRRIILRHRDAVRKADATRAAETAALIAVISEARTAGWTLGLLADLLGVSEQRVGQMTGPVRKDQT